MWKFDTVRPERDDCANLACHLTLKGVRRIRGEIARNKGAQRRRAAPDRPDGRYLTLCAQNSRPMYWPP